MQFIFIKHNDTIPQYGNGFSTSMETTECEWKWWDKIFNRQQRLKLEQRTAAEDLKAFRTNPHRISLYSLHFPFFNYVVFPWIFLKNIHQQILRGEIMRHNSQDTTKYERFKPKTICLINCKHWASMDCETMAIWAQTHQTSSHTCQQGERGGIFQSSKTR